MLEINVNKFLCKNYKTGILCPEKPQRATVLDFYFTGGKIPDYWLFEENTILDFREVYALTPSSSKQLVEIINLNKEKGVEIYLANIEVEDIWWASYNNIPINILQGGMTHH